ncbi:hypothetical protein HYU14_01815 [Candidatus Woesearchaeota archaeon]|nr:hypothetical protein [Candidatus Woesearchaeota archaeon]
MAYSDSGNGIYSQLRIADIPNFSAEQYLSTVLGVDTNLRGSQQVDQLIGQIRVAAKELKAAGTSASANKDCRAADEVKAVQATLDKRLNELFASYPTAFPSHKSAPRLCDLCR